MGLLFRRRRPIARLAAAAATAGTTVLTDGQTPATDDYTAPEPSATGGEVDELSRLARMHDTGALTDREFSAAKAQLLGL